jgi:hypothetical protein
LFVRNYSIAHDFKGKIHCLVSAETAIVRGATQEFDETLKYLLDDFNSVFSMMKHSKPIDAYGEEDNYELLFDVAKYVDLYLFKLCFSTYI